MYVPVDGRGAGAAGWRRGPQACTRQQGQDARDVADSGGVDSVPLSVVAGHWEAEGLLKETGN